LENLLIPEGPSHQGNLGSNLSISLQSCSIGRGNIHCHTAQHINLKKGRDTEEVPVKNVSTWIRNQRKEPGTLTELRGNTFLSITMEKFG
jgi:hypothetical protein